MPRMKIPEHRLPVHEAMRPIKNGVLDDQTNKKTDWQIVEWVCECIPIDTSQTRFVQLKQTGAHDWENQYRLQGHPNFSLNSLAGWPSFLDSILVLDFVGMQKKRIVGMTARHQIAQDKYKKKDRQKLFEQQDDKSKGRHIAFPYEGKLRRRNLALQRCRDILTFSGILRYQ